MTEVSTGVGVLRRPPMAGSLFWRLWVPLMALVLSGCVLVTAVVVSREATMTADATSRRLGVIGDALLPLLRERVEARDLSGVRLLLRQLLLGSPVLHEAEFRFGDEHIDLFQAAAMTPEAPAWFSRWLALAPKPYRTELQQGRPDLGVVSLVLTKVPFEVAAWRRFVALLQALAALVACLSIVGAWRLRRELLPLRRMAEKVRGFDLTAGPSAPLPMEGAGELRELSQALNATAQRLRLLQEQQQATERALRDSTERKQLILATMRDPLIVTDARGLIRRANAAAERLLGCSEADGQGGRVQALLAPNAAGRALLDEVLAGAQAERRTLLLPLAGQDRHFELSAVHAAGGGTGEIVWQLADRTDEVLQREALRLRAEHDPLTGLLNRTGFAQALQERRSAALAGAHGLTLCLLDLDHFDRINESYGRPGGDQVLRHIARRLKAEGQGHAVVAYLGGDEFALLCETARQADAQASVQGFLEAVRQPMMVDGSSLRVTASAGVTVFPADAAQDDQLLRHAELAMAQAKQSGRDRATVFDPALEYAEQQRHATRQRVAQAIDEAELRLHYQPKVDMRQGRIVGLEALVRWEHPERGLLSPAHFLPAIEDSDTIVALDTWVIERVLAQLATWQAQGTGWPVAVNVSARHFARADFDQVLAAALARHPSVPASWLEIEVVESAALADIDAAAAMIGRCKALGVSFALDDFGVGYASLSYLRRLPTDKLKIDRSFVIDMLDDADDMALVEGVISLAGLYRREVIAEGVETAEHGALLMRLGSDVAQGYGIARPMPGDDVMAWARAWRPPPIWTLWAGDRWDLSDLPLLTALYDHRRWVRQVLSVLDGSALKLSADQLHDPRCCRFGHWYYGRGRMQYGDDGVAGQDGCATFRAIEQAHDEVHRLGAKVVRAQAAGQTAYASAAAGELLVARDSITEMVEALHRVARG